MFGLRIGLGLLCQCQQMFACSHDSVQLQSPLKEDFSTPAVSGLLNPEFVRKGTESFLLQGQLRKKCCGLEETLVLCFLESAGRPECNSVWW